MKNPLQRDVGSAGIAVAVVLGAPVLLLLVVLMVWMTSRTWGSGLALLWLLGLVVCATAGVLLHVTAPRPRGAWVPWALLMVMMVLPSIWQAMERGQWEPLSPLAWVGLGWATGAGLRALGLWWRKRRQA